MNQVVRLNIIAVASYYQITVMGLNALDYNGVSVDNAHDPKVVFLQSLVRHESLAGALLGRLPMRDIVDALDEMFLVPGGVAPYVECDIGLCGGQIYWEEKDLASFLFPHVGTRWFDTFNGDQLDYIISAGGVGVLIGARRGSHAEKEFCRKDEALGADATIRLLDEYAEVVVAGHDGLTFVVFSRNERPSDTVQTAIKEAVSAIESTEWFKSHSGQFVWDEEYSCIKPAPITP